MLSDHCKILAHASLPTLGFLICASLTNIGILLPGLLIEYAKVSLWWIASTTTSLLLFFRVCAVFAHSRTIKPLFCFLLLVIAITPATQLYKANTSRELLPLFAFFKPVH